jgi:capsular exopolysaccharide synthesis family protein
MEDFEQQESGKSLDVNKLITIVLSRWYFILGALVIALTVAFIHLRYAQPKYLAETVIKFDDERGGQIGDLFKYGRLSGRLDNMMRTEVEVLQSRATGQKTIEFMGLQTLVKVKGNFITSTIYPNKYFDLQLVRLDSNDLGKSLVVQFEKNGSVKIISGSNSPINELINYGDTILLGNSLVCLQRLNGSNAYFENNPVTITLIDPKSLGSAMQSGLVAEVGKNTSTIQLSYVSDLPELAADYLNALVQMYINESVYQKKAAGEQAILFIDQQLLELSKEVSDAQADLTSFKSSNKSINLTDVGKSDFTRLIQYETEKGLLEFRKKQLQQLLTNLNKSQTEVVEMVVFDPEDAQSIAPLFQNLNLSILEYQSKLARYNTESPVLKELQNRIDELKRALLKTVAQILVTIDNKIIFTQLQIGELNISLASLPAKEQALLNLERNFKINEKIYGYLQEKRLETLIAISGILPNISVIEEALVNRKPFSPNPQMAYLIAVILGLAGGIGLIFFIRLFYNKIPDKETIELESKVPVLGIIKKLEEAEDQQYGVYVMQNPKSLFAESIRGIRTNANFILKGEKHQLISLTSTVSGEGKTFCSINLAASFSQLGYKVLIVGCDLRRPKLHEAFENMSNQRGLTTYLVNRAEMDDVIFKTHIENLNAIPAGPTPPNPAELLQTEKFVQFIEQMKQRYDYVFLDTAPVGLVADSLPLLAMSDLSLYVFRAQYSRKDFCTNPDKLATANGIKNLYSLLNAYDASSVAYSSLYQNKYNGSYSGSYSYYGSYYSGGYGAYGRRYYQNYYSGYYTDEVKKKTLIQKLKKIFKK